MNKLTELYVSLLTSTGCEVIDDHVHYDGKPLMLTVEGKKMPLVIPTRAMQRRGDMANCIAFHPACENIFAGQSEVLNLLTRLIAVKLYEGIQVSGLTLLGLAVNKEKHGKLSLAQRNLIKPLSGAKPTVIKAAEAMRKSKTGIRGKDPMMTLRLSRDDRGQYNRLCEFKGYFDSPKTNASKANKALIELAYAMPFTADNELDEPGRVSISIGSNSKVAPYLEALLDTYYRVAICLNDVKRTLSNKHCGAMETIDVSWYDDLPDLGKLMKRFLPSPYPGNTGRALKGKAAEAQEQAPAESIRADVMGMGDKENAEPASVQVPATKAASTNASSDVPPMVARHRAQQQATQGAAPAPLAQQLANRVQQPHTTSTQQAPVRNTQPYQQPTIGSLQQALNANAQMTYHTHMPQPNQGYMGRRPPSGAAQQPLAQQMGTAATTPPPVGFHAGVIY